MLGREFGYLEVRYVRLSNFGLELCGFDCEIFLWYYYRLEHGNYQENVVNPNIQVLLPTDWSNAKRGDYFENLVAGLMQKMRFRVVQRVKFTGMEIDCLAENLDTKKRAYVECKFIKSPFEADFISKMIGNAIEQECGLAYLFSTATPGKEAKGKIEEIRRKNNVVGGILRTAFIEPADLVDMYLQLKGLPSIDVLIASLPNDLKISLGGITFLIAPEEPCWIIEQVRAGVPTKAYVVSSIGLHHMVNDFETIKILIEDAKLWIGLELQNGIRSGVIKPEVSLLPDILCAADFWTFVKRGFSAY